MEKTQLIILYNDCIGDWASEVYQKVKQKLEQAFIQEHGKEPPEPLVQGALVTKRRFADTEIKVKIPINVREHTVVYIHGFKDGNTTHSEGYIELFFVNDALRRATAEKIIDVIPYLAYTRADTKDESRVTISASTLAYLTEATGANRVITTDLHCGQIQGFYKIPVDNLYVDKIIAEHIIAGDYPLDNMVIGCPDRGAEARGKSLAAKLGGLEIVIGSKERPRDENGTPIPNESEVINIYGDCNGKSVLIFDDILDTCGTVCNFARALIDNGALGVYIAAPHGLFSPKDGITAEEKLFQPCCDDNGKVIRDPLIEGVIVTDVIPQKPHKRKEVVSVTDFYAEVIKRTFKGESLSELFEDVI